MARLPLHLTFAAASLGLLAASSAAEALPPVDPASRNLRSSISNDNYNDDELGDVYFQGAYGEWEARKLQNYPTKDPNGIYCQVGLGMTRDITSECGWVIVAALDVACLFVCCLVTQLTPQCSMLTHADVLGPSSEREDNFATVGQEAITVASLHYRYCKGSDYCFVVSTQDVDNMIATFGPTLGDVEWDGYYDTFFAAGCQGDFGTSIPTGNQANLCQPKKGVKNFDQWKVVPQIEGNGAAVNSTNTTETIWSLEYCCDENYCSDAHRVGGSSTALAVAAAMVGGLGALLLWG
jgi:hypothetical protein